MIQPNLKQLAQSYSCNKKICRSCYARLNKNATHCRKCHSNNIRLKKKIKD